MGQLGVHIVVDDDSGSDSEFARRNVKRDWPKAGVRCDNEDSPAQVCDEGGAQNSASPLRTGEASTEGAKM